MKRPPKRVRKIAVAVFRGLASQYNFDVFPISPAIASVAAVFIFSRRHVDKAGRAHHTVSCLGEADSLPAEIRRHRRAACAKQGAANVVCVLKILDKAQREAVVEDIAAARAFICIPGKTRPGSRRRAAKPNIAKKGRVRSHAIRRVRKNAKAA